MAVKGSISCFVGVAMISLSACENQSSFSSSPFSQRANSNPVEMGTGSYPAPVQSPNPSSSDPAAGDVPSGTYPSPTGSGGAGSYPSGSPSGAPGGSGVGSYPSGVSSGTGSGSGGYPNGSPSSAPGSYPSGSPSNSPGGYPSATPSGSPSSCRAYPTAISVNPQAFCGPVTTPSNQSLLKSTKGVSAVLYKSTSGPGSAFGPNAATMVQAWDSSADVANIQSQLVAMKPFSLPLNQTLSPGTYQIVMYDSSKQKAPYSYNWGNSVNAVAPILDSVAGYLDYTQAASINVDSSGHVSMPSTYEVLVALFGDSLCQGAGTIDPLTINLGSGPIALSSQASGVSMDLDGSGTMDQISWPVQPNQVVFLVNNVPTGGAIGPSDIFGNYTIGPDGKPAANGYEALRKYDDNGDGVIDANDKIWSTLRVWQDLNRNGIADPGELLTMAQAKILAIELPFDINIAGNHITKENCQPDQYGNVLCNGKGAYVKIDAGNGKFVKKQLIDIGFKPQ